MVAKLWLVLGGHGLLHNLVMSFWYAKNESLLKKIITEIYQQKESISKGWIS